MCAVNRDDAINKLWALRDRLDRRADCQPSFPVLPSKSGRVTLVCPAIVGADGKPMRDPAANDSIQEFVVFTKQMKPFLIALGRLGDEGSVIDWALQTVTAGRAVTMQVGMDGSINWGSLCDHPYRMLALAIDMAFPQQPPKPKGDPGRPPKDERNKRIRAIHKDHNLSNDWAELARAANGDEEVLRLNGGKPITRDVVRNAVLGRRKKGVNPQ